jgi:DNA-binding response OmpR family regulator
MDPDELQVVLDYQSLDPAKNKLRLEVLISRLRSKLSPHTGQLNPIKSVRGRGYQLCMPLALE